LLKNVLIYTKMSDMMWLNRKKYVEKN